jgi:hypothetical protein
MGPVSPIDGDCPYGNAAGFDIPWTEKEKDYHVLFMPFFKYISDK